MQARQFAGCKRLIYNSALEQRSLGYWVTGKSMSYKKQTYGLKEVKADPEFAFLRDAPAHVLQQGMADVDKRLPISSLGAQRTLSRAVGACATGFATPTLTRSR